MPSVNDFRKELRLLIADPLGSAQNFAENELDLFRDQALRDLYKPSIKLYQEASNYAGTHTAMPLAVTTTLDYAMPTGWSKVIDVSYWSNEANTLFIARSGLWDDRERSGFVRIYDAPSYVNYRIMLQGVKKWSGVADANMPDEVYEVVLLGAALRAAKNYANRRASSRRSAAASRTADTNLGSLSLWYRQTKSDWMEAVRAARKAWRPVGR